jgi:hypothetical protein
MQTLLRKSARLGGKIQLLLAFCPARDEERTRVRMVPPENEAKT